MKEKLLANRWIPWLGITLAIVLLSFALAWASSRLKNTSSWLPFLATLLLAGGGMLVVWWMLRHEKPPRWLGRLLIGAALLRLTLGVFWFLALPLFGYGSPGELRGYVTADASARDQAAWRLAHSPKSLWTSFQHNRTVDQYGGMLFMSASLYRYLGGQVHRPLQMVVLAAACSALAVLFTWAFARRAWSDRVAALAAWGIALYPEAVFIGSSQLREAFTMTLAIAAFYGLLRSQQEHSPAGLAWTLGALLLFLPFSPPFAALMALLLALAALPMGEAFLRSHLRRNQWIWLTMVAVVLLVLAGLWMTLKPFVPDNITNPITMLLWWVRKSAGLQAYLSQHASGWMQKVFRQTPEGIHLPILLVYGVAQPFLPAALIAASQAQIWQWVAIFRAVGWTVLLPFLIYAPFRAWRYKVDQGFTFMISLIVWLSILVAAFRGGSDLWDNPRYRATFAGLQIALAAWVWVEQRQNPDAWFRRALYTVASILVWFLPWYMHRYTNINWPIHDLFKTLGLGLSTAILVCIWDWARTSGKEAESTPAS